MQGNNSYWTKKKGEGEGEGGVCAYISLGSEGKELGEGLFSEEHESDATNPSVMEDEFLKESKERYIGGEDGQLTRH